ncbi:uncharacterized protein [Procambarus clarkii]|uniref:uncharacterized protein n=1 Tax=Procambarus clarkii TaxID=6728 RepID=UPI0037431EC1
MIQSILTGKAQIAYFTLSLDDSSDYDAVKKVVLMAYQLVPEAYRQKFWNLKKTLEHTFTKFANIKERLFQEWCASRKVKTKEQLEQLILLEDFKDCLSGDLKTYLEEQQIETLNAAATMAEEYILTHRPSTRYVTKSYTKYYAKHKPEDKTVPHSAATSTPGSPRRISPRTTVVCWTSGKRGHMAAKCCGSAGNDPRRVVMLVSSIAPPVAGLEKRKELFAPYTSQGYVSSDHSGKPVVVLRDSGAAQSLILEKSLPEGVSVDGKQNVILGGFPSTLYVALLIKVYLESQYFSGECYEEPFTRPTSPDASSRILDSRKSDRRAEEGPSSTSTGRYHSLLRKEMKRDVRRFCKSCHACQLAGKANQPVPKAPLCPIPSIGEPFEHLILDIVGPLPPSTSGVQYLFTILDRVSRYPEAISLKTIMAKVLVKHLHWFFSRYGLPRTIQTDQGSNFTSRLFRQQIADLGIQQITSSAFHPESQGALERFHQTLKGMLRNYCYDRQSKWAEDLPYLLFAVRLVPNESLDIPPFEIIYGHSVRGPLEEVRNHWLDKETDVDVVDWLSTNKGRLFSAWEMVKKTLVYPGHHQAQTNPGVCGSSMESISSQALDKTGKGSKVCHQTSTRAEKYELREETKEIKPHFVGGQNS